VSVPVLWYPLRAGAIGELFLMREHRSGYCSWKM
jgi:hypothetical protein